MALMTKTGLTQWLLVALLCVNTLLFVSGKALVKETEGIPSSQRDPPNFKPRSFTSLLYFALHRGAPLKLEEKRNHLPQVTKVQSLSLHRLKRQLSDRESAKLVSWLEGLAQYLRTTQHAAPEPNPTPEPGYPCCLLV